MREDNISAFEKGMFPYADGFQVKKETNKETDFD